MGSETGLDLEQKWGDEPLLGESMFHCREGGEKFSLGGFPFLGKPQQLAAVRSLQTVGNLFSKN